jgi:hypothetical protein
MGATRLGKILVVVSLCMSVAGCARMDFERCEGYGFAPGTGAFAQCMQQVDLARRQALSNAANSMQPVQWQTPQMAPVQTQPFPQQTRTVCTPQAFPVGTVTCVTQ